MTRTYWAGALAVLGCAVAGCARQPAPTNALSQGSPDPRIVVEGHTDSQGSQAFNLHLSTRRAQAVRDLLISRGVAEDRIRSEGLGFSRPIADNKSAEGRANNRRVELVIQPQINDDGVPVGETVPKG